MSAPSPRPVVLILGATSAIATALARRFAGESRDLLLAARDTAEAERIAADLRVRSGVEAEAVAFHAEDLESHAAFTDEVLDRCRGRSLEGAVLCFGHMDEQAACQQDFGRAQRTLVVNFVAAVSVLERLAAHLEGRGDGFLCALASVAGDRGRQSNYLYGAAKGGLATYLQGLRHRLARSGVSVTAVKPGFVDTKMTFGLPGLFLVASPDSVARAIHRAIRAGKAEIYVPWFWRWIMTVIRWIPDFVFRRTKL